jgi:hypothetical protein
MKLVENDTNGDEDDDVEPPPVGHSNLGGFYADDVPFGEPPAETVTLVGKVPWELTDSEAEPSDE